MTDYGRREADRDNASRLRVLRQAELRAAEERQHFRDVVILAVAAKVAAELTGLSPDGLTVTWEQEDA